MSKKNVKTNNIGKTKRSTDEMINDAIAQQNSWMENRRAFAKRFLKTLNIFARPAPKNEENAAPAPRSEATAERRSVLAAYWFPILCAVLVILIAVWAIFLRKSDAPETVVAEPTPVVSEQIVEKKQSSDEITTPTFDIVRIERDGNIVVAGRWMPQKSVSIEMNGHIVATEGADYNGEFVYAPTTPLKPGNYTIALVGSEPTTRSADKVFVYISEQGYENSVSLLMTRDGSTLLQAPSMLRDGDLVVSKIDYLDTGRIVITGDAMPRLRVSLTLDGKYLGFARVSDHRHFGLGADVGKLEPGREYELAVRMHDGDGRTIATIEHKFTMPEMTGDDDTFYTVRRGDCLWVIARNFLRRGILFSIIAERNNIKNPDLIFPKQKLQIPVDAANK